MSKGIQKHAYRLTDFNGVVEGIMVVEFIERKNVTSHRARTENPNGIVKMCVKMFKDRQFAQDPANRDIIEWARMECSGQGWVRNPFCFDDSVTFEPMKPAK